MMKKNNYIQNINNLKINLVFQMMNYQIQIKNFKDFIILAILLLITMMINQIEFSMKSNY